MPICLDHFQKPGKDVTVLRMLDWKLSTWYFDLEILKGPQDQSISIRTNQMYAIKMPFSSLQNFKGKASGRSLTRDAEIPSHQRLASLESLYWTLLSNNTVRFPRTDYPSSPKSNHRRAKRQSLHQQ